MSIVSFAHTDWSHAPAMTWIVAVPGTRQVPASALAERILVAHLDGERKLVRRAVGDVDEAEPVVLPMAGDLGQLDEDDRRERGRCRAGERAADDGDPIAHELGGRLDLDVHRQGRARSRLNSRLPAGSPKFGSRPTANRYLTPASASKRTADWAVPPLWVAQPTTSSPPFPLEVPT